METGKHVVLVDFNAPEDWSFIEALEIVTKKKWEIVSCVNNRLHGGVIKKLRRYVMYFWLPLKILFDKNLYIQIIAWQQFYGLILAFYLRLFHVKNAPEITVMTFIYKSKKGITGKLYFSFMRSAVQSGYVKKFVVFSKSEPSYYADLFDVSESYFQSEVLGIDDTAKDYEDNIVDNKLYLSAGRSNRDYDFLREAWEKADCKLEIICDEEKRSNTENISYLTNCHGQQYMQRLAHSYAVVIPLLDEKISSGQLVILQSLMLGKPVIVTKNSTVGDYIKDGFNGLIIDKTEQALLDAVFKLSVGGYYENISKNARRSYEENFSIYAMGLRIGKYFKE
ncbi:MAG: glycosyltransferase [Oscillospiraceae bacterium]|nr:glycosyltransferase [Oscillospiraceae bacterium]